MRMKQECVISIIIPVHNTAQYLKRCVESVRNQTLKDIEIILVDNLSCDGSSYICDEYAKVDSRVRVLHLDEAGLSIARNAGIDIASAPYIGFVDSDDYVDTSMFEDLFVAISRYNADIAYCNFFYEYEDGRIEQLYPNTGDVILRSSKDMQRDVILERVSSSSWTKLFRREALGNYRFPKGMYFEDHSTLYRWLDSFNKVVWLDKAYYHYIQREDSICHTLDPIKLYHYFLAEYHRLEFVREHALFEGKELRDVVNLITKNCYHLFSEFMKHPDHNVFFSFGKDMRRLLKRWLVLSKSELEPKYYKRLRKISYFWPIYYWTHFSRKR